MSGPISHASWIGAAMDDCGGDEAHDHKDYGGKFEGEDALWRAEHGKVVLFTRLRRGCWQLEWHDKAWCGFCARTI